MSDTKKRMKLTLTIPQEDSDDVTRSGIAGEWNPDMTAEEKLEVFLDMIAALVKHECKKVVRYTEYTSRISENEDKR